MKKFLLLCLVFAVANCTSATASIVIDNVTYQADTLVRRQVGPGIIHTIVRLPNYPLNAYVLETDLNNPNNRVETTQAYNTVGRTELLTNAYSRNRTDSVRPVAGCNANFWIVSGSGAPLNQYGLGTPLGGVVRNDTTLVNTNNHLDKWDGGPTRTGVVAITSDKTMHLGHLLWTGIVSSTRLDTVLQYHNINRRCVAGEIALWNKAYSTTREFEDDWIDYSTRGNNHTDNYYLTIADDSHWGVNTDMRFIINRVVNDADRQTLGDYEACLTVTGDDNKRIMASLVTGDTIVVSSCWMTNEDDAPHIFPDIENLVEGNAPIMHNGELTSRNYDETYNTQVYSRTCVATSADGKHLYQLVIDKSTSPQYGTSAGCPTAVACQILKQLCPDVTEMVNLDAGGSAQMMVLGNIVNTTTESTPRAVACGWFLNAVGREDSTIASIAFDSPRLMVPVYSSVSPRVLGYNATGELIDENVQGFSLSCDKTIGTTSGSTYTAGGNVINGTLTATLNGMTATVPVQVLQAQPAIDLRPIVIDTRDYPIRVTATVNNTVTEYDPSHLDWWVNDTSVAGINNGVLHGVSCGTTTIGCSIGEFNDQDTVIVEISPSHRIYQSWQGWTIKGTGAKDIVFDTIAGDINFNYSTNRAPYLQLNKSITFYSLPDTIALVFQATCPIDYVQLDARNRYFNSSNFLKVQPDSGFAANIMHTVLLDIDALGGIAQVGTYPITLKTIKFGISKTTDTGANTLSIKSLYSQYSNISASSTATGDVNADGEITIADVNAIIDIILGNDTDPDTTTRADVNLDGEVTIADVNAVIDIILAR